MKMANTKVLLLVLCLAVYVEMGRPWGEDVIGDAKDAANDAKEKTEGFANWAYDKISHGLGLKDDDKNSLAENAKFQTEDKVKSAASGATKYAAKAAEDAKEKAKGAYDEAKKQTDKTSNIVGNKATDAYEQAKYKVGEAYKSTKETVTKESP